MLETCTLLEPGVLECNEFLVEDRPVWVLGRSYNARSDFDLIKADLRSRLWFTYRKNFAQIGGVGPSTDQGWGCMLRCGQMLLAESLMRLHLGREWRWDFASDADERYLRILQMFSDKKHQLYSIHQVAQMGVSEGKAIGQWFGPNTIAHVLKKLTVYDHWSRLAVYVGMDNTVIVEDVIKLSRTPLARQISSSRCSSDRSSVPVVSRSFSGDEPPPSSFENVSIGMENGRSERRIQNPGKLSSAIDPPVSARNDTGNRLEGREMLKTSMSCDRYDSGEDFASLGCSRYLAGQERDNLPHETPNAQSSLDSKNSVVNKSQKSSGDDSSAFASGPAECSDSPADDLFRPILIIVPLRLGLSSLNPVYHPALKQYFMLKQSIGIIGGRPNHALYFAGSMGDSLLYLDPHECQTAVDLDVPRVLLDDRSYHCPFLLHMHMAGESVVHHICTGGSIGDSLLYLDPHECQTAVDLDVPRVLLDDRSYHCPFLLHMHMAGESVVHHICTGGSIGDSLLYLDPHECQTAVDLDVPRVLLDDRSYHCPFLLHMHMAGESVVHHICTGGSIGDSLLYLDPHECQTAVDLDVPRVLLDDRSYHCPFLLHMHMAGESVVHHICTGGSIGDSLLYLDPHECQTAVDLDVPRVLLDDRSYHCPFLLHMHMAGESVVHHICTGGSIGDSLLYLDPHECQTAVDLDVPRVLLDDRSYHCPFLLHMHMAGESVVHHICTGGSIGDSLLYLDPHECQTAVDLDVPRVLLDDRSYHCPFLLHMHMAGESVVHHICTGGSIGDSLLYLDPHECQTAVDLDVPRVLLDDRSYHCPFLLHMHMAGESVVHHICTGGSIGDSLLYLDPHECQTAVDLDVPRVLLDDRSYHCPFLLHMHMAGESVVHHICTGGSIGDSLLYLDPHECQTAVDLDVPRVLLDDRSYHCPFLLHMHMAGESVVHHICTGGSIGDSLLYLDPHECQTAVDLDVPRVLLDDRSYHCPFLLHMHMAGESVVHHICTGGSIGDSLLYLDPHECQTAVDLDVPRVLLDDRSYHCPFLLHMHMAGESVVHHICTGGSIGDSLLYLDPHECQTAVDLDVPRVLLDDRSYHCPFLLHMHMAAIDPSLALAFLVQSPTDLTDLCHALRSTLLRASEPPLFELMDKHPKHIPPFEPYVFEDLPIEGEGGTGFERVNSADPAVYDSEEEFEILEI